MDSINSKSTERKAESLDALIERRVDERIEQRLRELGVLGPRVYSQRPGELPPATGDAKYKQKHREGRRNGDPEVWREGKSLLMTSAAWERLARSGKSVTRLKVVPLAPPVVSVDEEILAELGARRRIGGSH